MKKHVFGGMLAICGVVSLTPGCGKKGDPIAPVIPHPLPAQEVSAEFQPNGITLSWRPPTTYDTEKPLDLKAIEAFTVYRRTESPVVGQWSFTETAAGWSASGSTEPVKIYKGVLRTASAEDTLLLRSPDNLELSAQTNRYVRLKFWSQGAQEAYLLFITSENTTWDIAALRQMFQPAVHTSFASYQKAFAPLKLKPFPLVTAAAPVAHEYLLDMSTVTAWQGTIKQVGLVLRNPAAAETTAETVPASEDETPQTMQVELGLESVAFAPELEDRASRYERSPWLFLDDAEGWKPARAGWLFGATEGVLYAQGNETVTLLSTAGQDMNLETIQALQIRMQVTAGAEAYLVMRKAYEKPLPLIETVPPAAALHPIRLPLQKQSAFQTYTIAVADLQTALQDAIPLNPTPTPTPSPTPTVLNGDTAVSATDAPPAALPQYLISQFALVFPALQSAAPREILIDYIAVLPAVAPDAPAPPDVTASFEQPSLPSPAEIQMTIRAHSQIADPEYTLPYVQLPGEQKEDVPQKLADAEAAKIPADALKLFEIAPEHPAPAEVLDGVFRFTDTGQFVAIEEERDQDQPEKVATLEYGKRYTYYLSVMDRKERLSELSAPLTLDYQEVPRAPEKLSVEASDQSVTLRWDRPLLTTAGKKIRSLQGFNVFRLAAAGAAADLPLAQLNADTTTYTDSGLTNGQPYYYLVQSVVSATKDLRPGAISGEVTATPIDNVPPDMPVDLVGVYLEDAVTLYWKHLPSPDFVGFNVYRGDHLTGPLQRLNTEPVRKASYKDATVEPKKRYYYHITAFDDEPQPNESAASETVSIDTVLLD